MSLATQLRAVLNTTPAFDGPLRPLAVEAEGDRLVAELAALDRFGLSCAVVRLETGRLANADAPRLKRLAEALSGRLTYLLEPIAPIEIDAERCIAQLRSKPPHATDDARTYYELLVTRGGAISLRRHRTANGGPRTDIPFEVTREVLLRLADDFDAAARQ